MKTTYLLGVLVAFAFLQIANANFPLAPNVAIVPNPTVLGGLNSQFLIRRYILVGNVTFSDGSLILPTNNTNYSINVTDTANVVVSISNWFDEYGTVFSVDRACHITLNVSIKGEPSLVYGASYTYNASTTALLLSVGARRTVNIHWGLGGYAKLGMPLVWYHSAQGQNGYKTAYGFGLPNMSLIRFDAYIYSPNGTGDIANATLTLEDGTQFYYDPSKALSSEKLSLKSDPHDQVDYKSRGNLAAWDSHTQTLRLGWPCKFTNYTDIRVQQNTTLTIGSAIEGNVESSQYATYFFHPAVPQWSFIDDYFMLGLGLGGLGMAIGSPAWGIQTLRTKGIDDPEKLGLAGVLTMVGIGLVIIWLW